METFFDPTRPCIGRMVVRLRFLLKLSSIRLVLASESRLSDWRVELVVGMRLALPIERSRLYMETFFDPPRPRIGESSVRLES